MFRSTRLFRQDALHGEIGRMDWQFSLRQGLDIVHEGDDGIPTIGNDEPSLLDKACNRRADLQAVGQTMPWWRRTQNPDGVALACRSHDHTRIVLDLVHDLD